MRELKAPKKTVFHTQVPAPPVTPRLLRIPEAAHYLSCTYGFIETLIREKTVRSWIQGKRRVMDIRDLDDYIERKKAEVDAAEGSPRPGQ
jgi:excisionase family DNA binding protein